MQKGCRKDEHRMVGMLAGCFMHAQIPAAIVPDIMYS